MVAQVIPADFAAEALPDLDVYDELGVDVTQIVDMLALTPEERLEWLAAFARGLLELMDAAHPA